MTSQFPADVVAAAQASHSKYYPKGPYASVSLAQWAVESAYGHDEPPGSNNPFGIKAVAGQPYVISMTREVINGISEHIPQHFAKYFSLTEAFDAHAKLLATSPIYAEAQAATTPEAYVRAMAKPYATAPNYPDVVLAVMKSQNLYQFDRPVQTAAPVNQAAVAPPSPAPAPSPADRINAIQGALYQIEPSTVKESWLARGEAWLAEHLGPD